MVSPEIRKGQRGEGLEKGLTRIVALSWKHGHPAPLLNISLGNNKIEKGLVVAFGKKVLNDDGKAIVQQGSIDENSFQLFIEVESRGFYSYQGLLPSKVIPVALNGSIGLVTGARQIRDTAASGAAFLIFDKRLFSFMLGRKVLIVIKGNFVLDETRKRVIDAEHLRGSLPTGDREAESMFGIQGGRFESWISKVQLDINSASAADLTLLPGVTASMAKEIIAARPHGGFNSIDDIQESGLINAEKFKKIKDLISVRG